MNNSELITMYMNRFINRLDIWSKQWVSIDKTFCGYALQSPVMDTKGNRFPYEPVSPSLVGQHIAGKVSCAWPALDERMYSKWLCFDSDTDDGALNQLESFLKTYQWHVIREGRRPHRDGHLWVLFDAPVQAAQLIVLGQSAMKLAGTTGLECFPKTATGLSQVRGPLGINLKPEAKGARGWFDGVEQNITSQLEWLAVQPLNRAEDAIKEAEKHKPKQEPTKLKLFRRWRGGRFECTSILELVEGRKVGGRHLAQCPLCALEGHDRHRDNLHISLDGTKWCCVFGGPNQVHKSRDIILALKQSRLA